MKKILLLPLFALTLPILSGCNKTIKLDDDFDGLYNDVDPDKNNNEYRAKFKKPDDPDSAFSNEITFKMDYRELIPGDNPTFNSNVAEIGAMLALDSYSNHESIYIQNNVYHNDASEIFNLYGQFGVEDVVYQELSDYSVDQFDICGLYLGNHLLRYNNTNYQFFFCTINAYINETGWVSNFDLGADCTEEKEVFGEHPDWTDKINHKGFDVTSKRAYELVNKYINKHAKKGFKKVLFGCGQSRGGAITNLLGKKFSDLNKDIDGLYYCFNPALTTTADEEVKESYRNIFNCICKEDFVSLVPLKNWNFDLYGQKFEFSHAENQEYYEYITKKDYQIIPESTRNVILNTLSSLSDTRENIFRYAELDEINNVYTFDTENEAREEIDELLSSITDPIGQKCNDVKYVEPEEEGDEYRVEVYIRPCIIIPLVSRIFEAIVEDEGLAGALEIFAEYSPFISTYLDKVIDECFKAGISLTDIASINEQMLMNHGPFSTVISVIFSKPME